MAHILLLNGAKNFGHSKGRLNTTLHAHAAQTLQALNHSVAETQIEQGYNIEEEIEKILKADALIWQMPGWWMGEPWIVKKYMDEVFTTGHGKLYKNDGRSHAAPTKNYGKGGLLHGKKYMFSLTWNAPIEAFTEKEEFFEGVGVDGLYLHLHKANQFLGMQALPTFICNDVIKNPRISQYLQDYTAHLQKVFLGV
ncbi:Modulator of drug activity [Helicobacter ailurogastricus]|uniref:NAD(P)H-dependent oxidoreductase n=1 Tax=Helicobacter ailurogastricus TaxID=1578720 RepID=UPI00244D91DE|nr:NAD(P)H-dependent oxidoreductase [Helicobacter ailurogastricus]GMB90362.1 Modulator of drug activity [Helicobacter ailurogastricus]